jgi:hypothetical protein
MLDDHPIMPYNFADLIRRKGGMGVAEKCRVETRLPPELVEEVDRLVGPRKRTKFIEKAISAQLRRESLKRLFEVADEHLRGVTLEDTYYISRAQLEARGGEADR